MIARTEIVYEISAKELKEKLALMGTVVSVSLSLAGDVVRVTTRPWDYRGALGCLTSRGAS